MLSKMIVLMCEAHKGQYDKAGKPYYYHPLTVMQSLKTDDEELMMIALGHDLLEDTTITVDDLIIAGFSARVISGIIALTKQKGQSYDEYKAKVFSSEDAMRVKLADLEHNMDLTRLPSFTDKDLVRLDKYRKFRKEIRKKLYV